MITSPIWCIALRRNEIIQAMKGNEGILEQITISKDIKTTLLSEAMTNYTKEQQALKKNLDKNQYEGQEPLGITQQLLDLIHMPLRVRKWQDLSLIQQLSPQEMAALLSDPLLKNDIDAQIKTIDVYLYSCLNF